MTDNIQELDEILDEFLTDIYMNNEHFAANQEALDKTKEEPMQALLDWHNKQVEEAMAKFHLKKGVKYDVKASDSAIVITHTNKLKERDDDQL